MFQFNYLPDWRWLGGAALLAGLILFLSYYWAVGRPKWWLRVWLMILRSLSIATVVVCLLNPQWIEEIKHQQTAQVAVLLDSSKSMGLQDVPGSRLTSARNWLKDDVFPACPPGLNRSLFTFNESLEALAQVDSASATGRVTALGSSLQHLLALGGDQPLAGVILCSDGIESEGGDALALAKLYRRKGIPIHTATFGTTREPKDIVLENVQVKRAVPNEAPTRIRLTLRSPGYINERVPVRISRGGVLMAVQEVRLAGGEQQVEMDFTPRQKGFTTYEVSVPTQTGEWLTSNNRRHFGLEVVDPTIHVIYMEGTPQQAEASIPEWKYLKDALESDPNIKVKVLYQLSSTGGQPRFSVEADPQSGEKVYPVNHPTMGFPRTLADLLKYDVVIHSDIKVQYFTAEQLQNMARFVEQYGGGFVMVGGNSAFGKGGYQHTIIDRIIPVAMQQFSDSVKLYFPMQVMPGALEHPLLAIGHTREETRKIWTEKLPRFHGLNRVDRAKPGAVVLGTTPSQGGYSAYDGFQSRVLIAVQDIGKGRSMAFTSDITRTWGADFETLWGERINPAYPLSEENCDSRYYKSFWINAVRWLAAGRLSKTNNAVTVELSQTYSLVEQPATARVKVRDGQMRDLAGADVKLVFSLGTTNIHTNSATFDAAALAYVSQFRANLPGQYTITAVASMSGKKLGEDQQLLTCEEADREMVEVRARPDFMAEIARFSGGKNLTADPKNTALLASAFGQPPPATISYRETPLWDKAWWLACIVGLLALEWGIRRWRGLA